MTASPSATAPPQGAMTSDTLTALVRAGVARRLGEPVEGDKTVVLTWLAAARGAGAVVDVGLDLRHLPDHPVIAAITAGVDGQDLLARWMRLERFGHSRNRTRVDRQGDGSATMTHYALDGGAITPVNDLFVWGLIAALLERAGFADVTVRCGEVVLYAEGAVRLGDGPPPPTASATLTWGPRAPRPVPPAAPPGDTAVALATVLADDVVRPWRVAGAARRLARSTRSLQRALKSEGTSFSTVLQTTRVQAARTLMADRRLGLTEIAFCAGFADHAHFTRAFRRVMDVPPSAWRALMAAEDASCA